MWKYCFQNNRIYEGWSVQIFGSIGGFKLFLNEMGFNTIPRGGLHPPAISVVFYAVKITYKITLRLEPSPSIKTPLQIPI